jgi:hypothetical protein
MPRLKATIAAFALALAFAPPALAQPVACRAPLKPMLRAELYFGRSIDGRHSVSDRQWARFLARELAPRFPGGLTVLDGEGRWRDAGNGALRQERSKVVIVVMDDDAAAHARLADAMQDYKRRFKQKSVGLVTQSVCAAF